MKSLIAWFAHNGVIANLLLILMVGVGLISVFNVKREVFPEFSVDIVTVTVPYRGATPAEVEEAICVRIEEAIQGLDGIKRITSTANEGAGTVTVEVMPGFGTRDVLDDVKNRVDAISTFPAETERPIIQEIIARLQVINVSIAGDTDELTLKRLGEQVRDELLAIDGISQAELKGARPYEISVEVSEQALRRYGLTFDEVSRVIRTSSLDLPGGAVRTGSGEVLLRTQGQAYFGPEFENIALITAPDGRRLLLGDIARVVDGFEETDQFSRLDGKPAVMVQVFRAGNESAPEVAELVRDYVREAQDRMPEGVTLSTWQDLSEILQSRQDLLVRNALQGLVLVFIILALFMRVRLAFWVAAGIPATFLGAIALMPYFDVSINMMSLFSFILVLGIVVDDAIIVGERVFARQQQTGDGLGGAVAGAQEVAMPVIFGVLTTVTAFAPFLFVSGVMGTFTRVIPLIVIPVLLFSLIESQFILPYHISRYRPPRQRNEMGSVARLWDGLFTGFSSLLDKVVAHVYRPSLTIALGWRYLTVSVGIVALLLSVGLVAGGFVETVFFPEVESDNIIVALTLPQETPAVVTAQAIRSIEATVLEVGERVEREEGRPLYRHVLSSVGEQPSTGGGPGFGPVAGSPNVGEVNVELVPTGERPITSAQVASLLREAFEPIPGAVEFSVSSTLMQTGKPIDIMLAGSDIEKLRIAAAELREKLAEYPGVIDITDTYRSGKPELKLAIRPQAENLGLSLQDLARQVRQAFFGEETQRIQRGRDDVRVMVRYPEEERRSVSNLEQMRIRASSGAAVPFMAVADVELGESFARIRRVDRQRAINVTAGVDEAVANAAVVLADLEDGFIPELLARHPGVTYALEGQQADQAEFIQELSQAFLIALFVIYALMAVPFKSYVQPLLVMSAVPFGLVGAVLGHYITGMPLSFLSMLGMVAVTGVVVNDSLVLVHFINTHRQTHESFIGAVREAGVARFRPILLTSLTTAAGVTPLMLETSVQAQFLIPMAISMAFGVLFATLITLVLVPAGYMILEDILRLFRRQELSPGPDVQ